MKALKIAEIESPNAVFQEIGIVVARSAEGLFVVEGAEGRFRAKRAVACLVEPREQDKVLLAGRRNTDLYILSVLERPSGLALELTYEGDLVVNLKEGRFVVAAAKAIDLVTSGSLGLTSGTLDIRARQGEVFLEKLAYLGRRVVADVGQVKTVFDTVDSVVDRLRQTVSRSYRFFEQLDQVRAAQVDHIATETMRLRGRNTVVHAEKLVKIDGDQIHLG